MTHTCKAGECSITCEKGCGCIGSGSNCECVCDDSTRAITAFSKPFSVDDKVDVRINELSLMKAALLLNASCDQDILIPANKADSVVSLDSTSSTMANIIDQLGLTIAQ